ncbi:MAG: CHAT domain-containing tetratricopeptide repeat protein [Pirellulaceae bacterium]
MSRFSEQTKNSEFLKAADTAIELQAAAQTLMGPSNPDVIRLGLQRAVLLRNASKYNLALEQLDQTLKQSTDRLGRQHVVTGATFNVLGSVYRLQGKLPEAQQHYDKSIEVLAKSGVVGEKDLAEALANYCDLLSETGDYVRSLQYGQQAYEISKRLLGEQHDSTLSALINVAMSEVKLGEWEDAERNLLASLRLSEQLHGAEHVETAIVQNNLGLLNGLRGRLEAAIEFYEQALNTNRKKLGEDHPATAKIQSNLGQLYSDTGDLAKAKSYLGPALETQLKHLGTAHASTATTRHNLGCVMLDLGQYAEARKLLLESAEFMEANESNFSIEQVNSRTFLGLLEAIEGNPAAAINQFDVARENANTVAWRLLPQQTSNQQRRFMDRRFNWTMYSALSLAYEFPESQEVLDATALWLANGKAIAADALAVRHQTKQNAAGIQERQSVSLANIRSQLSDDSILVDILRQDRIDFRGKSYAERVLDPCYVAWVTCREGDVQRIELGDAAEIEALVTDVRQQIAAGSAGGDQDFSQIKKKMNALSKRIWTPIANKLPESTKRIWISPDGSLWLVPWSALANESGRLLVEDYSIGTVSSGRALVRSENKKPAKASPSVVFADPNFDQTGASKQAAYQAIFRTSPPVTANSNRWDILDRETFHAAALPGTVAECDAIVPSLTEWLKLDPLRYQGPFALESVAKSVVSPRVIVFATHGFFVDDVAKVFDPLQRCGLILNGFNDRNSVVGDDDGVLTGTEISGLDLQGTELVVLSACDTGVGRIEQGNGVAGLRRAFELAGCDSVVATLWQIPDLGTVDLMKEFFSELKNGASTPVALQRAQLRQIESLRESNGYAHPFRWAGFAVSGKER